MLPGGRNVVHILFCGNSSHDWVLLACPIVLGGDIDGHQIRRGRGACADDASRIGFYGIIGDFWGGVLYHCCLKGCTILKGKLLGNISLKQGCIGNWNAWVHDRQRTHSTFWDMCWSSVVSCELVLFPSDFGNVKVRLSHIGGICDRIEVLGIPPQRCLYSALGFASKQGLGC